MYVGIGVVRADLASDFTERSRYVYVAAFFMSCCSGLARGALPAHPAKRVAIFVMAPLLVLSITANAADLQAGRGQFQLYADLTRSYVTIIDKSQDQSWMTQPERLRGGRPWTMYARSSTGMEVSPPTSSCHRLRRDERRRIRTSNLRLVGRGFRVDRGSPPSPKELQLRVLAIDGAEPTPIGACLTWRPTARIRA